MKTVRYSSILVMLLSSSIAFTSDRQCLAQTKARSNQGQVAEIIAKIDQAIVGEFQKAWRVAGLGIHEIEGVVLLYRNPDGTIKARSQGQTNQRRQFTLTLTSDVIAIVHTHPNSCPARPAGEDLEIADRLRIPVFTITNRGMYVYDPGVKKISMVRDDLDWLNAVNWVKDSTVAINRQ
ncbi:MAG TPA: hypothetical protein VLD57_00290 [Blastocatellia bacterium]|nr:hypothetical protein [Blastocatellia bacterium]